MIRLHDGAADRNEVRALRTAMRALSRRVRSDAAADAPLVRDALQEAVEAILLEAALRSVLFPGPAELGVEVEPYLLGLGDVVGELRRRALIDLAEDRLASAERWVRTMDRLYQTLMRFDTTRAIVPLKPKQDTARSLLERTRGEVVMARVHARHSAPSLSSDEEGA
jgi:translin